jgi:glycosyltransferase involved in cell wall biosynthesis
LPDDNPLRSDDLDRQWIGWFLTMPLHVLQLGPYPPPEGGITHNILAIRDELRGRGHRCSIAVTSQSLTVAREPDVYHPRSAAELLGILRSLEYEVLHLHVGGEISRRVMALAAACTVLGGKKKVLTIHSGGYPLTKEGRSASPNSVRGRIFRRYSKLIGVNEAIADVFRRSGVDEGSIHVISPVALREPKPGVAIPPEIESFRTSHSPLLLAVGGLERDYDPLLQIAAMRHILESFPGAGLMIVGDGSLRPEASRAVEEGGLSGQVLLAGNVGHEETLHLINDADVLLRTTLFDGDAISVREALFLGTPVIATDTGDRPDGVRLVPIGDASALADAVNRLLSGERTTVPAIEADDSNIAAVVDLYEEIAT